jgi:hypothetical protein
MDQRHIPGKNRQVERYNPTVEEALSNLLGKDEM